MRLDRWLKLSRLLKRRTVAQMACQEGRVFVNDRPAKSSLEVKAGDRVHLELGSRAISVEITTVPEKTVQAAEAASLYSVKEIIRRPPEVLEWLPESGDSLP